MIDSDPPYAAVWLRARCPIWQGGRMHFWVKAVPADLTEWDPDVDPSRYPSGVGHGIFELHQRLQRRGEDASIGRRARPGHPLVAHLESLWDWNALGPDRRAVADLLGAMRVAASTTIIRGDIPLTFTPSLPGALWIMPSQRLVTMPDQTWLPMLPQRGLIPRDPARLGSIRTVGVLAFDVNVPCAFRAPAFRDGMDALGMTAVSHTYDGLTATAPPWHDLSNVDVVICVAADPLGTGYDRKPATKLVNAWNAGCVPITLAQQSSYMELVRPGVDAVVVDHEDDVLAALGELTNPELVRTIERGGRERAAEFSPSAVLGLWQSLLTRRGDPPKVTALLGQRTIILSQLAARRTKRLLQRHL